MWTRANGDSPAAWAGFGRSDRAALASGPTRNRSTASPAGPRHGVRSRDTPTFPALRKPSPCVSICPPHFFDPQAGGGCGGGDELARLRFPFGDETANFLDKPGAFAFLPATGRRDSGGGHKAHMKP